MLYARCREPALKIGSHYDHETSSAFVGSRSGGFPFSGARYANTDNYLSDAELPMVWSLSEEKTGHDEARRDGRRIRAGVAVEVVDPEVLTACPHVAAFLSLAAASLKMLWANPMALRHGVLEHAVELRDALSSCRRQITPRLRRVVEEVAAIGPLPVDEAELWRRRAEGRPRMLTHNGLHHYGRDLPLTRASQVVAHAGDHVRAAEFAARALRRLEVRNHRLSWEERAVETNSMEDGGHVSCELLSSQAVALHAGRIGVHPRAAIAAARDGGARIFAAGPASDRFVPDIVAVVDEGPDGTLSVREVLRGRGPDRPESAALLERHLAAAAAELAPERAAVRAPGM
jgi:hypothetical protein